MEFKIAETFLSGLMAGRIDGLKSWTVSVANSQEYLKRKKPPGTETVFFDCDQPLMPLHQQCDAGCFFSVRPG